jgi:hypothetical protein
MSIFSHLSLFDLSQVKFIPKANRLIAPHAVEVIVQTLH